MLCILHATILYHYVHILCYHMTVQKYNRSGYYASKLSRNHWAHRLQRQLHSFASLFTALLSVQGPGSSPKEFEKLVCITCAVTTPESQGMLSDHLSPLFIFGVILRTYYLPKGGSTSTACQLFSAIELQKWRWYSHSNLESTTIRT